MTPLCLLNVPKRVHYVYICSFSESFFYRLIMASFFKIRSYFHIIQKITRLFNITPAYTGVNLGSLTGGVAKCFLYQSQFRSFFHMVCGKGVSEHVWCKIAFDSGFFCDTRCVVPKKAGRTPLCRKLASVKLVFFFITLSGLFLKKTIATAI